MKLQNTLILTFISLLLLNINVYADELSDKNAACNTALNKGDIAGASGLADAVLKRDANNREGLICKGRLLGAQGKYDEALSALKQAETASKESFDRIIVNMLIGNAYKAQQKYTDAIASYEKSLGIAKADKNDKFMRTSYNLIGEVFAKTHNYNAALTSYSEGSKLAMNDNERAENFEWLAATYSALGQHDAAIEYQLKGLQMEKKSGTLDGIANAYLALGGIYMKAKEYAKAEKNYTKLLEFSKENGGAYFEAQADFYMAQAKAANGDTEGANALIIQAKKIAKEIGATDLMADFESASKS